MFDRATCVAIRLAASRRVDTATLIASKACLGNTLGAGLCGGPSPASFSTPPPCMATMGSELADKGDGLRDGMRAVMRFFQ